jgi:hypothetical protein
MVIRRALLVGLVGGIGLQLGACSSNALTRVAAGMIGVVQANQVLAPFFESIGL